MQTGGLKKRRKRNIAKVIGLSLIPYDESADTYRGLDLYKPEFGQDVPPSASYSASRDNDSFNVTVSRLHEARRSGRITSSTRVTRDPTFTIGMPNLIEDGINDFDYNASRASSAAWAGEKSLEVLQRPYLLDKTVMMRLRQLIVLGVTSINFPWSWNKSKHRIDKWSPVFEKLWTIVWVLLMIQTTALTGFQFYSFYSRVSGENGENKTYREVFMNTFSVFWYCSSLLCNLNLFLYKEQLRHYINTLFAMNRKFCDKYLVSLEDYKEGGRVLINVSIPTNCTQVFVSVSLFLVMPYQPWYLYSYIYKDTNPWYWLIPGAVQEYIVVGHTITSYLLISWVVVAHTNSVDFWLREIHNHNDTGYTVPEIRDPKTTIEVYKSLQILCTCFNDCMAPFAIALVKWITSAAIIPCGYVLIRSMNHIFVDEFPGILTYPLGVIDCATVGFAILKMGAEMHDLGIGFVDSWTRTKQKDFRRILASLPVLKIKIGHMYYITLGTTITFFKTTTDYIIDCIMTFP